MKTENSDIALRSALWAVIRSAHPQPTLFGLLVDRAKQQGFTPAKARAQLDALALNGAIEFDHNDQGRVVVIATGGSAV